LRIVGDNGAKSASDHSIFTHQDDAFTAEGDTNLVHLVGTNVVDIDDEDGGVLDDELLELLKIELLLSTSSTHVFYAEV